MALRRMFRPFTGVMSQIVLREDGFDTLTFVKIL